MTYADMYYERALELDDQGKTEEAVSYYRKVIALNPNDGDIYFNLGVKLNEHSLFQEAFECYCKAVQFNPSDIDAYFNMGLTLGSQGKTKESIECYEKVIELDPNDPQAHNNMGIALKAEGDIEKSIACFRKALQINPSHIQAYNNLGIALADQGETAKAIECYGKVLELDAGNSQAYNNMGIALKNMGRADEAILCFRKALEISPDFFQAYSNLGNALQDMGNTDEAIDCYLKSIEIRPDHSCAYFNMGTLLRDQGDNDEAITYFRKTLQLEPANAEACKLIADLLNEQGKTEAALSYYKQSLEMSPDPGLEVRASLLLPVICDSNHTIEKYRKQVFENLDKLIDKGITLDDPLTQVAATNFLFAYHGLNDREIQKKIADFYIKACPDLTWTAPHCDKKQRPNGKITIGMISTFLHGHTIGQLFFGLIKHLSRELFHVKVFRFPGKEDPLSKAIDAAADEVVMLPYELAPARQIIAGHSLDILFYLDIGMDPMTYFLAFSRLAPVQCKRGHPVTSGIPNVDYFISTDNAEIPGAEDHYSERLVRLKRYGIYYYPPDEPKQPPTREYFDLPQDAKLYLCPQTLFKFHPDYDFIFGSILRKDPQGMLVLIEGRHDNWTKMLRDRFARNFPDAVDRVRFLPPMSHPDFLSLFLIADAVLDTPCFSGGKTSMDCFAFGVPIVTLPGEFMRGRLTLAQYKQMGVMECVAESPQEFINLALRLANDPLWRDKIKEKIKSRSHLLYRDIEAVRELERFFEQAIHAL